MKEKFKIAVVGGPDVNFRIDLMRLLKREFKIFAVGSNPALTTIFNEAGFKYHTYPLNRTVNPISDLISIYKIIRIFQREKPTVVHAFGNKICVLARISAWLAGIPVIIGTMPGLGTLYAEPRNTRHWDTVLKTLYELSQRLASKLSDITILQNQEDADMVLAKHIVPPKKLRLILGSGIRTDLFNPTVIDHSKIQQFQKDLRIPEGCVVVIMAARLIRTKGVFEYLEAARIIKQQSHAIKFLLVGNWDKESADALSYDEINSISKDIDWLGMQSDMPTLYALSDICVLPSYYREGIPRVLMEAASMGLSLISTDMPGCREVVNDGQNGFLIPTRDSKTLASCISRLAAEPELRKQFGNASRELATQRFDIHPIANQIENIYSSTLVKKLTHM